MTERPAAGHPAPAPHAPAAHAPAAHAPAAAPGEEGKLQPRERSAALPASTTAEPPHPAIAPTGYVAVDAFTSILNRAIEPWQSFPEQHPVAKAATIVNAVLGVFNFDIAIDAFNMGVANVMKFIPYPSLPAAVLGMPHLGIPHTHTHPPALPAPLPSLGQIMLAGCLTVYIGGLPAARAGDLGLALTCGSAGPAFEIAAGSSTVFIGGSRAARMTDITKHCGASKPGEALNKVGAGIGGAVALLNAGAMMVADQPDPIAIAAAVAQAAADAGRAAMASLVGIDPGVPPCLGMVMLGVPNVLIGGFPMAPIENYARAFCMKLWKKPSIALKGVIRRKIKNQRLANFFEEALCHVTGHPVDVANGRVLTSGVDLQLPGPIPLVFKRNYASTWSHRDGVLGRGWSHSYDQAIWNERGVVVYRADDGREIEFELEPTTERPWLKENERWDRFNRLILRSLGAQHWEVESADGVVREFGVPVPAEANGTGRSRPTALTRDLHHTRLLRIRDRTGHRMSFRYDAQGHLKTIVDSAGREILLETNSSGRLTRLLVPHPTADGWMEQARYEYSLEGDLVEVYDALGNACRMAYDGHLLARETNRNELSFYFTYEGGGPDARCVKTWGDGGIYERKIVYDVINHVTIATDSYGHDTKYQMNADNAVVAVTDALGGVRSYTFDDSYRKIAEKDPLGHETRWEYDARGNCTKMIGPDGAEVELRFNERNQAVRAIDSIKGEWQWGYDETGQLMGRADSLGRRVQFRWGTAGTNGDELGHSRESQAAGRRLIRATDPAGHDFVIRYDAHGNIASLRMPDATESRWQYDRLGRCVVATDARGNAQRREYDAMGRVTRVRMPDGNVREIEYDPEGSVVRARDLKREVRFEYQGMGRIRAKTEAGTTIGFEYDKEERLVAITNEHGHVYKFQLGPTGQVEVESGFDGVRRKYERDLLGHVTKVTRPGNREAECAYDAAGRLVSVKHSDGSAEAYAYRPDGELIKAQNDTAQLTVVRDGLGRVIREVTGADWIASEYDVLGTRVRVRSSKNYDQHIQRNSLGQAINIRATNDGLDPRIAGAWEAKITRDALGLEVERVLPGGVRSKWERDAVGRPIKHELWSAGQFRSAVQYHWEVNDRLQMVIDAARGPTWYEHDALGNLAAATYADGRVEIRMPDEVGNLFRTRDRRDRKYGPAGQILESRGTDGRITRYEYDAESNLVRKVENAADGDGENEVDRSAERVWSYQWNAAGRLAKVTRPDGDAVVFTYDAFGRRLSKTFRDRVTRWIWDGHVPLHEWVEKVPRPAASSDEQEAPESALERAARYWNVQIAIHPPVGPPASGAEPGTPEQPITWLFDPGSFAPMAKLVGNKRYGIVTDQLGTPTAMFDEAGEAVWSASIDVHGGLRDLVGPRQACPFRWPGQYEDEETGLHYNRYRYYDPDSGAYVSQDPIGLAGGWNLAAYVRDPLTWSDPGGLSGCADVSTEKDKAFFWSGRTDDVGGDAVARNIASSRGGTTLEKLLDDRHIVMPKWNKDDPAVVKQWTDVSSAYAKGVSGEVRVVLGKELRPGNVWETAELPALKSNPNVSKITAIDPKTQQETVIFMRSQ